MTEVYLDNAATTRVYREVADFAVRLMCEDYGNPSAMHRKGLEAERYVKDAAAKLAKIMKVDAGEIIFTSGGTESSNMALIGGAMAGKRAGKHIITTRIEHPSVYNPVIFLEQMGFEVTWTPVDEHGRVRLDALKAAIRQDTILVSVMAVNNEIGTIEPLDDIARIIHEANEKTLIHVDGVQAFGKIRFYPKKLGIDMLSVSGHKFHAPKGTGFLWVRNGVRVNPLMLGGGQQKDRRSGTDNVPGWAAMAMAAEIEYTDFEEKIDRLYGLRDYFIEQVSQIDDVQINGGLKRGSFSLQEDPQAVAAPHIVSVSFANVRAEVLLHALEERGIYVSSGSACSSNHPAISGTLKAIGAGKAYLDATIRFSFSFETTKEEIDICISALQELVPMLRRYTPGGRKKGGRHV